MLRSNPLANGFIEIAFDSQAVLQIPQPLQFDGLTRYLGGQFSEQGEKTSV